MNWRKFFMAIKKWFHRGKHGSGDKFDPRPPANSPVPTTISVTPSSFTIVDSGTQQLVATVFDQFGAVYAGPVTWATSNPAIATVSNTGLVTFVSLGTATITVFAPMNLASTTSAATMSTTPPTVGATKLAIVTQPVLAATPNSGVVFATQPVVRLRDAASANVLESGILVTAYLSAGTGSLGGTKQIATDANGRAIFTNLSITGSGSHTVSFHALMSSVQTIWSDDAQVDRSASYFEVDSAGGRFGRATDPQNGNLAWKSTYLSGTQANHGSLHLAFGRGPDAGYQVPVYGAGIDFGDVTAEWDVRHTIANPWTDKMGRLIVFAEQNWAEAAIGHIWAEETNQLKLDPVTGVDANGVLLTTGYNDFANFTWMGAVNGTVAVLGPTAATRKNIKIRMKLDTPGQSDGIIQQYVDDVLDGEGTGLAFTKTWTNYGINALFIEAFTNDPQAQTYDRYFDNILITGKARSVVASAALTVTTGAPPPPTGNYPNEPAGYTVAFENDFDQVPHSPPGVYGAAAGTDWWDEYDDGKLSLVVDGTAPAPDVNGKAIRWAFPDGQPSGSSPVNFNINTLAGSERHEQYVSVLMMIEGSDFENQSTGCKLGYFGYAEDQDGVFNQCIIMFFNQTAVQAIEGPLLELGFIQQGATTGERYLHANVGATLHFPIGQWNQVEYLMKMNSVGSANGELHVWVNGTKYHEHTDIVYRTAGLNKGFQGWKNEPVWGGIGGTKTRADYWRVAHLYGSGTPFIP
ncbi:MAG TPA: Ig-like domain-containing protein [Candidatus Heimdallarchaeota archaeon]|nr:Ig-like domain-containing protein [Candidatus Heimdallarchaeota archaeon]